MNEKYNLALVPMTRNEEIINLAHKFSNIADKYLLGESSLPHVTLYQFEIEKDKIENMWIKISQRWAEKPTNFVFEKFSCITFDNIIYWVSLLPSNSASLYKMHAGIAEIIDQPIKKNFDPHMTLINTKNKNYKQEVEKFSIHYKPIKDNFILTLGKRDDVGQFTKVLYQFENS